MSRASRRSRVPATLSRPTTESTHRVLAYTAPGCSWCVRVKQYLRQRNVRFREVDVSRDAAAARDLARRTGQMGVPVVEIDGDLVIGFDKPRIDRLLGLAA